MNGTYAGLKLWQIGVIVAFLVIGFGGSYFAYTALTGSDDAPSGEHQQLIPVTRGNLVNDVSINGSVGYPNRETLSFDTQGAVGHLLVEEGQAVAEGETLAVIDAETVAGLEEAVADAEVRLRDAEEGLETALNPFTALEIARAESDVASASVALEDAIEDLTTLVTPPQGSIAQAESKVADARFSLSDARDALAELLSPAEGVVTQAEVRVTEASAALDEAREALAQILSPDEHEVEQAEAKVASARVALGEAREALAQILSSDEHDVEQAGAKVVSARLVLEEAREALEQLLSPDGYDVKQAEDRVATSKVALAEAMDKLSALVEPDAGQIAQAEADVADSEKALADASEALDALLMVGDEQLAKARSAVTDAKVAYDDAVTALQEFESGPSAEETAELQDAVELAEESLASLQTDLRLVSEDWAEKVASSSEDVDDAEDGYARVFQRWLGIEIVGEQLRSEPAALLGLLGVDLEQVFTVGPTAYTLGLPPDDPATVWSEPLVHVWLRFYPSEVVATCSDEQLPGGSLCVTREMDDAWEALSSALDALETVEVDADKAIAKAEADVDQAADDLGDAREALAEFQEPVDSLDLEAARARVELAAVSLESAREDLAVLEEPPETVDVDLKEKQVALARARLQEAKDRLAELKAPSPLEVEAAQSEVALAEAALADAESRLATLVTPDPLDVEAAQSKVTSAELELASADSLLTELVTPEPLDVESARNKVTSAELDLADAESLLAELVSPDPLDVDAAQGEIALAEVELEEAEADLTALTTPDELEVETRRKKVALAEAELADAEADLAALTAPDPGEVELKQKQVEVARAVLDDVREDMEVVKAGPDPLDVALSRAEAASALASLEAARDALAATTLRAPWGGVVSAVNVEAGDSVNPNTAVLELLDPSVVEINGVVDEIDVLYVREGAAASVTMDALAGQTIQGSVAEVGTVAQSQSGVVTYPISIQMRVPAELDLPEGLSAVATVVLREDRDVLLVPVDALYGSFDQPVVRVSQGGSFVDRDVVLGNSDGFWVVVESGVAEAELVLMESQDTASEGVFGALRGLVGGGFGGPRGLGGGGGPRR